MMTFCPEPVPDTTAAGGSGKSGCRPNFDKAGVCVATDLVPDESLVTIRTSPDVTACPPSG